MRELKLEKIFKAGGIDHFRNGTRNIVFDQYGYKGIASDKCLICNKKRSITRNFEQSGYALQPNPMLTPNAKILTVEDLEKKSKLEAETWYSKLTREDFKHPKCIKIESGEPLFEWIFKVGDLVRHDKKGTCKILSLNEIGYTAIEVKTYGENINNDDINTFVEKEKKFNIKSNNTIELDYRQEDMIIDNFIKKLNLDDLLHFKDNKDYGELSDVSGELTWRIKGKINDLVEKNIYKLLLEFYKRYNNIVI